MKRVYILIAVLTAMLLSSNAYAATDVLVDGFEGGIWNAKWNGVWIQAVDQVHDGMASAKANGNNDGMFTTVDINTSAATSITVDFWFRKDDTDEGNDFILYYYDGSTYNQIADLDALGPDDTWLHYTHKVTESRYFKTNFRVQLEARNLWIPLILYSAMGENVWIDDFKVSIEATGPADYDADGFNSDVDCNDHNSKIYPGAEDICGDGIDQDCTGTDESCPSDCQQFTATNDVHVAAGRAYTQSETIACSAVVTYYAVGSSEPLGEETGAVTTTLYTNDGGKTYRVGSCPAGPDGDGDHFSLPEDCNDSDASIHPGANDICGDSIDQDCDGNDRVCPPNDLDGDTFIPPADCNDNNPSIHPAANDICEDGIDQNCDGVDPNCPPQQDYDNDGHSPPNDCNDSDPSIHPGANDICEDGIDQNCNGSDLSCGPDMDGDGYGQLIDCNDNNRAIFPGAVEVCGDGIDQDCSGHDLACAQPPPACVPNLGNWKIKYKQKYSDCTSCHTTCTRGGHSCAVGGSWGSMNCVNCHSSAHF